MVCECMLCKKQWTVPGDNKLVSHGLCSQCEVLYNEVIDGKRTLEEAKEEAKR